MIRRTSDRSGLSPRTKPVSVVTLIDGVAFTVIDGLATCRQHTVSGRAVACGRGGRARARRQLRFLARSENPEVVATSARVPSITLLRSRSARALWVLVSPPSECSLERNGQSRARQVPTPAAMRLTARQGNYPSAILGTLRDGRARPSLTDCDQERRTDHRLLCSRSPGCLGTAIHGPGRKSRSAHDVTTGPGWIKPIRTVQSH